VVWFHAHRFSCPICNVANPVSQLITQICGRSVRSLQKIQPRPQQCSENLIHKAPPACTERRRRRIGW
jgi:hypothetical protein